MAASSSYSSELARLAEHAHLSWVDFLDVDPDHEVGNVDLFFASSV
tara:strand:- start:443 stop:580 length:138 start_codon:yes stop_codon:yes gene_type:complete